MTPLQRLGAVGVTFIALTALMTAPLAWNVGRVLPTSDDAYFSVWRLAWVAHQLASHPSKLFDANIFYPVRSTLAYSDATLLLGIASAPAIWVGVHPVLAHNILLLAAFVLSGVGAFVLTRHLTDSTLAATLAGVIFAFAPYKFGHVGHLELQWTAWMPFALWALHRLLETAGLRFGLLLGALLILQGLTSLYYLAFFGAYTVILLFGIVDVRSQSSKKHLTCLCVALLLAGTLLAPYLRVYEIAHSQIGQRTPDEVARYSATLSSYFRVVPENRLYAALRNSVDAEELSLFPGIIAVVLAMLALWPPISRVVIAYAGALVFSVLASLGPNGVVFPLMRIAVPPLATVRAPARFGVLVLLSVAVLAAIGCSRLLTRIRGKAAVVTVMVLMTGCLAEYFSGPVQLRQPALRAPSVFRWLAVQPAGGVVLALPLPRPDGLWLYETTYEYLSIYHWQPLINGYSGFAPLVYLRTLEVMRGFPDEESVQRLRRLSVAYLVVCRICYSAEDYDMLVAQLGAHPDFEKVAFFPDLDFPAFVFRLRTQ